MADSVIRFLQNPVFTSNTTTYTYELPSGFVMGLLQVENLYGDSGENKMGSLYRIKKLNTDPQTARVAKVVGDDYITSVSLSGNTLTIVGVAAWLRMKVFN